MLYLKIHIIFSALINPFTFASLFKELAIFLHLWGFTGSGLHFSFPASGPEKRRTDGE